MTNYKPDLDTFINSIDKRSMKEKVIAVFDIGKTNKKLLLFDHNLHCKSETEKKFAQVLDDDGFECDDIENIENWIKTTVLDLVHSEIFDLLAVNFTTYGATLVYLDSNGKRLTPVYNYLKPLDEKISEDLYKSNGGKDEFCRRTASPALGMLNSGIQLFWIKSTKPDVYARIKTILHFPQYLSYILTGKIFSEHTSLGCHTALWDFDNMNYHPWLKNHGLKLHDPVSIDTSSEVVIGGKKLKVGIGIHDSSSSLVPYFSGSKGSFILISTGTWCINMNPFNTEKLTADQLDNDCLSYMSITGQPVKSSRLFLGHLHETAVKQITKHFNKNLSYYKEIIFDMQLSDYLKDKFKNRRIFLIEGRYSRDLNAQINMSHFSSFEESYHQLMNELCNLTVEAINLVLPVKDDTKNLYITGGFSKNDLFLNLITNAYPLKKVYTSQIANASALGAALIILDPKPLLDLGLLST